MFLFPFCFLTFGFKRHLIKFVLSQHILSHGIQLIFFIVFRTFTNLQPLVFLPLPPDQDLILSSSETFPVRCNLITLV